MPLGGAGELEGDETVMLAAAPVVTTGSAAQVAAAGPARSDSVAVSLPSQALHRQRAMT